jgi:hypothetical protein
MMKAWLNSLDHPARRIGALLFAAAAILALIGFFQIADDVSKPGRFFRYWFHAVTHEWGRHEDYWGAAWSAYLFGAGALMMWVWVPLTRWIRHGSPQRDS